MILGIFSLFGGLGGNHRNHILIWWGKKPHAHDDTPEKYAQYHEVVNSNRWFFSIIKHLDIETRSDYIAKYKSITVDEDAHIDIRDEFSLKTLCNTDYSLSNGKGIDVNRFISDLKKVVTVINHAEMMFYVKEYNETKKSMSLVVKSLTKFKSTLESINIGKYFKNNKWKSVNAYDIYNAGKNKNYIMKEDVVFYADNDDVLSLFMGYDYNVLDNVDESLITPYLNHIKEVISDGNEEVYEYILNQDRTLGIYLQPGQDI